jgi:hypothetical protein
MPCLTPRGVHFQPSTNRSDLVNWAVAPLAAASVRGRPPLDFDLSIASANPETTARTGKLLARTKQRRTLATHLCVQRGTRLLSSTDWAEGHKLCVSWLIRARWNPLPRRPPWRNRHVRNYRTAQSYFPRPYSIGCNIYCRPSSGKCRLDAHTFLSVA